MFRYKIGTDYDSYLGFFKLQSVKSVAQTSYTGVEYVYRIITKCISKLTDNFNIYIGIFLFFTLYFFYAFCISQRDRISLFYFTLFYLCILYGMSFNIVRQALAISLCTYALKFFICDQFIKYILIICLAASIHISALVMIPCWFIKYIDKGTLRKLLKALFVIMVVFCVINYKFIISSITSYSGYLNTEGENHYSSILYLIEKLFFIIPVIRHRNVLDKQYSALLYIILGDLMLCIPMLKVEYLYRIAYYFLPIYGLLIANFINNVGKIKLNKVYKAYYIIVFVGYFVLQYLILRNHGIYPYMSCFKEV